MRLAITRIGTCADPHLRRADGAGAGWSALWDAARGGVASCPRVLTLVYTARVRGWGGRLYYAVQTDCGFVNGESKFESCKPDSCSVALATSADGTPAHSVHQVSASIVYRRSVAPF